MWMCRCERKVVASVSDREVFRSGGGEIYCEVSGSVGNVKMIWVVSVSCRI